MNEKNRDRLLYILVLCTSAVIFMLIYGVKVLNPEYDTWLYRLMDLSQHYVGWKFYRDGAWNFPIGLIDNLAYPSKSSVIFTDSIPLFAVFFKVLSPFLPETFQYFGWWGILSFMLQGFFAVKILRRFSVGRIQSLIASVFFVISPMVLEKMFRHTALGGHWIILASVYLFVCHKNDYKKTAKTSILWGIIGALVAAIHLYYLPMCASFLGGYILCSIISEKKINLKLVLPGLLFAVGLLGNIWLLGGFSTGASSDGDKLGYYSFNLNGFFNSKGYSRIFEALPTYYDGQYEGFAYLGLGIIILLAFACVYIIYGFIKKHIKMEKTFWMYMCVYVLMSIGLILFAASPEVTFNDKLLFTYPYSSTLYHYWSIFRSSGRIVWPVCYLIYIAVIVCNDSFWKNKFRYGACIILAVCVCLQVYDLGDKLSGKRTELDNARYETFMESDFWDKLSGCSSVKHVVLENDNFDVTDIVYIADYASNNGWTMNNYYFARNFGVRENTEYSLNNLSEDCVYIFNSDMSELWYDLNYYEVDGYIVGTVFSVE